MQAVAAHVGVIVLPILLDLGLWLGPRLRISELIQPVLRLMATASLTRLPPQQADLVGAFYEYLFARWNLFTMVRTFPVGVPSLLTWMNMQEILSWDPKSLTGLPENLYTPLGNVVTLQVSSALSFPLWVVALTLVGWIGGGVYYFVTLQSICQGQNVCVARLSDAVWQTVLLSLTWVVILSFLGLPALMVLAVVSLFGEFAATLAFLSMGVLIIWLLLPFFFSPHGIFLRGQNAFRSILSGFQFVRFTAPTSSLFALFAVAVSQGLNLLWSVPEQNSWMLAVGIAGHAFSITALLAGSFIYYRDMSSWLQAAFEKIQQRPGVL